MSYDIYLREPTTKETIQFPFDHLMVGGTFPAEYDEQTKKFSPRPNSEAWLNITYNYSGYYYTATDGDSRFAHDEVSAYYADGTVGPTVTEYGIRGIYGKTGAESIPMLEDMIVRIEEKYKVNGEWIDTAREEVRYVDKKTGKEVDYINDILYANKDPDSITEEFYTEIVNEGPTDDYWEGTAGNAVKPLYQLLAMARIRPDGVWDGD